MNWDAVIAVAEVIGVIAVVVSLLYVGYQVRQNTLQIRQENLVSTVRGTLDTNWFYHRDPVAFEAFRRGVYDFDDLEPKEKAMFHSIVVDLAFYVEVVKNMAQAGLVDEAALETNTRFLGAILVTPGGQQWLRFAEDTQPMPPAAVAWLRAMVDAGEYRPITELQPWFARKND